MSAPAASTTESPIRRLVWHLRNAGASAEALASGCQSHHGSVADPAAVLARLRSEVHAAKAVMDELDFGAGHPASPV